MPLRYYVATPAGLLRLSLEFMEHKRPLRQLAGQSIKILEVLYSRIGDRVSVHHASGMFSSVNRLGFLSDPNLDAVAAAMDLVETHARTKRMKVPDIGRLRKRQIEFDKHRWKPTSVQLDSILADLTAARAIPLASRLPSA